MSEAQLRSMKKELFIIKEAKPAISDIQLPTGLDILQHLIYNQQCRSVSISSIIACPPKKNFSRCSESCCECILSKIKRPWIKAGFDVLTDLSLVKKLFKLHKSYSNLKKNAKRGNSGDLAKQNEFEIEIKKLFWAGNSNLKDTISKDKKRSLKDKIEDLKFLEDQENERKFVIGSEDIKYRKKAKESIRKKNRLQPKILRNDVPNVELIDTILSNDSSIESDFEPGDWYHIEVSENPDTVIAKIPKDVFAGNVSLTATACDISPNVLQKVTNAILYQSGVDLKEVKSSQSTAYRKMKKENENMAKISKEDVKAAIDASPYPCIIHFDGKTLFELNKGKMLKRDRMAVLVNINGQTYLLGVPPLASSTGEDQFLGVMNLIKEYQLMSKTRGICFDTTSSNTGTNKGSVSRISQELDKYLLQIACRHHVTELRMLHFWKLVTNEETSGPDNPLFKKLKNIFEEPNFNYNSVLLLRFDWNKVKSSFLEKAAMKSLTFCKAYVSKPGIIRDDRSELAELVVTYLSPITYKVRKTGAIHHARFLGKAIYYLKLRLLSNQLTFVQENDKLKIEIKLITEFIVCFYAKQYLQSEDVIKAPFLDITAIHQMHLYKKVCTNPIAVDAVLESQYKHCWYLDSTMIPLALLDDELASEEKAKIASAILSFDMPSSDYYKPENKVKQDIKEIYKMNTKIGKKPPSLSALVDVFSYLIFDMIGFDKQRVQDWLSLPPNYWHTQSCFKSFQKYAETLIFVNDHSERSIGMMGQYIHRYSDETEKHNRLLTVDKVRSVFRSQEQKSGTISKIKFNDGLGVMRKKIKS